MRKIGLTDIIKIILLYIESIDRILQTTSDQVSSVYLRAFKKEKLLELWTQNDTSYHFVKRYNFTATSGVLGPKKQEGDLQIPEGFYFIDAFNPNSKFHLSFRINYPNQADLVRNKNTENPGSDIYVHGGNSSIGCIAIGDENIEELFSICHKLFLKNTPIQVHIFPCKMEDENLAKITNDFPVNFEFWKSIQPMYHFFQSHKMLGEVTGCDAAGNYQLAIPFD